MASSGEQEDSIRVILNIKFDKIEFQKNNKRVSLFESFPVVVVNNENLVVDKNYAAEQLELQNETLSEVEHLCAERRLQLKVLRTEISAEARIVAINKMFDSVKKYKKTNFRSATLHRQSSDEFFIDISDEVTRRQHLPRVRESSVFPHSIEMKYLSSLKTKNYNLVVMETGDEAIMGSALFFRVRTIYQDPRQEANAAAYEAESRLIYGAIIAEEMKNCIVEQIGFIPSFGVSNNNMVARMANQRSKLGQTTIMTESGFQRLGKTTFTLLNLPGFHGSHGKQIQKDLEEFHNETNVKISSVSETPFEDLTRFCANYGKCLGIQAQCVAHNILGKCRGLDESSCMSKSVDMDAPLLTVTETLTGDSHSREFEESILELSQHVNAKLEYRDISFAQMRISVELATGDDKNVVENLSKALTIYDVTDCSTIAKFVLKYVRSYFPCISKLQLVCYIK